MKKFLMKRRPTGPQNFFCTGINKSMDKHNNLIARMKPSLDKALNLYRNGKYSESKKVIDSIQGDLEKIKPGEVNLNLSKKIAKAYFIKAHVMAEGTGEDPSNVLTKYCLNRSIAFDRTSTSAENLLESIQIEELAGGIVYR